MAQDKPMKFDPATGQEDPYPEYAEKWRNYHGNTAFIFNPWWGCRRKAEDIGDDPLGYGIKPEYKP